MNEPSLWSIFINACLINNFVLAYFLGICPFLGVSSKVDTAMRMGITVSFVMLLASVASYGIHRVLEAIHAPFFQLIAYVVVIASTVQLIEMLIKKLSPVLFANLGIFLPLITTNCAILGVALFQTNRGYDLLESVFFALGAGVGFSLALLLMAGIREKLALANVPKIAQGSVITLLVAGILSLAFMGFAGLAT